MATKPAAQAAYTPKVETVSKISIAKMHGKIKTKELKEKEVKPLARVFGQAAASKIGDAVILVGDFRAVSYLNGDTFTAKQITMPATAADMVLAAMGSGAVEFALDIGVKASKSAMGYEYAVKPVIAPAAVDVLGAMQSRLSA